jgi:hypothetical protein
MTSKKLSKSNKNKLIGGIITVLILAVSLFVKECFDKRKVKTPSTQIEIIEPNKTILNDSSINNSINNEQVNSNNSTVKNEYIYGNKNVNETKVEQKTITPKYKEPKKEIVNNGNLSLNQSGGNVTQTTLITTKPPPRKLTDEDINIILNKIPKGYIIDVLHPYPDKEPTDYAFEILTMLSGNQYKFTRSAYGQISPNLEQSFNIQLSHIDSTAIITIYRLR